MYCVNAMAIIFFENLKIATAMHCKQKQVDRKKIINKKILTHKTFDDIIQSINAYI